MTTRITGPENTSVTSCPSDAAGIAETSWNTSSPNRKGNGGTTTGSYTATTSAVTVDGFTWDGTATDTAFTLGP